MRISEDRYSRERARLELALRFLRHEARTRTIRVFTGLSDDRIRKLYRSYMTGVSHCLPRHRGKSPYQVGFFTRSQRLRKEAAVLASLLSVAGLIPRTTGAELPNASPATGRGELLCEIFEFYRCLRPDSPITFEHAVFLAAALARGDQLRLAVCCDCGGLLVAERFPLSDRRCTHCTPAARAR